MAALTGLTLTVFRLHGALLQWGDKLVEPLGLTSARWQMLGALALAGGPLTAPQIGNAMGVTRQGAQKQLNLLLELGLVVARPNPAHQRSPLYVLTSAGSQLYARADALWNAHVAAMNRHVRAEDALSAKATLDTMLRHLLASADSSDRP
ncbi:MarR family winged helix-turn-helix transcriptional regulator [Pigmentiphaga litoralis]|uniref:MarR family winged helix-turn-helix transcriptional regulator n=1 Tax=Pigmentiphaga litoralis TaxID=516702 RepID=UPI003B42E046